MAALIPLAIVALAAGSPLLMGGLLALTGWVTE